MALARLLVALALFVGLSVTAQAAVVAPWGRGTPDETPSARAQGRAPLPGALSGPQGVTWSAFSPTGWVTAVPATAAVTAEAPGGLEPATAAYAVSTDAGATWSAWSSDGLTVAGEVPTTQRITVTGLNLPDSASTNLIRFRIQETGGDLGTSPDYLIQVDTTPPSVRVLSPNGGEMWAGGQPQAITWEASDAVGLGGNPITVRVSYNGGAAWDLIAAGIGNTGSAAWTPPLANSNQVLIRVEAQDAAGNLASDVSDASFTVDSIAPSAPQNLQAAPAGWSNTASFTVTWTAPADLSGVAAARYKLDVAPAGPDDGVLVQTSDIITGIAPATDGVHALYVWLQDGAGNRDHTTAARTTLYLDTTAPAPPSALIGSPARVWVNVNRFSEQWTNPPDLSGIVGAYYRLNGPGAFPTDGTFVATTDRITDIAVPSDGKHDLYIWLVDAAGNVNHNNRNIDPQVFWYDGTPPTSTVAITPALSPSGWYRTPVTMTFSAVDAEGGSGVDVVFHRLDEMSWTTLPYLIVSSEGAHRVAYYARDLAENLEATRTLTVSLDFSPPEVMLIPDRAPGPSGWYTAPVTFTLAATDTLSGVALSRYRLAGGPWQAGNVLALRADGDYEVEYYAEDLAGNTTAVQSARVKLDASPPSTAYLIEGTQGQNGWFTSPLTVRLIPNDTGSGVVATYYRINEGPWQAGREFALTADGNYILAFYSEDAAGNVETGFPVQVRLDAAAPAAPTAVETIPAGWSRTNRFTVQWANPTDLSGIAGVYYRFDREPTAPDDGTFSPAINRLENLALPSEGAHSLYLWLRDAAGNADHRNRALAPALRYDASPPTTTLNVQGLAGTEGWYRSPITVSLDALDPHSGPASTHYRLNRGAWITGTTLAVESADKHVLEFYSTDNAGNAETIREATLRIDPNPPGPAIGLRAEPSGWQRFNSFRLLWREPADQSGIAGIYVRFNTPPSGPTDGTFYPANEVLEGLPAPGEGQHTVYAWLRDRAGNSNHATAVALPEALWYDGTPPTTAITLSETPGPSGWYLRPVDFSLSASDDVSGLAAIRWRVDDGAWQESPGPQAAFTVEAEGQHVVQIASVDRAGNVEPAHEYRVALDRTPPTVSMGLLSRYQSTPSFTVSWSGADPQPGSGLLDFDIQVRDGWSGAWVNWLTGTTNTRATYVGQRGHTYFFRARARDRAGNYREFTGEDTYTVLDAVRNGDFDAGNFSDWTPSGDLRKAVVPTGGPFGRTEFMARLGSPEYGPSTQEPGQVPVSSATIAQLITVPRLGDVARPTLSFWYRIFSYDVLTSPNCQPGGICDSLDVSLYSADGAELIALLWRDGNTETPYGTLFDSGWRLAHVDLSPWAGQTVNLVFANWNRWDNLFNTWSFVDHIQVQDWPYSRRVLLPRVAGLRSAQAAQAEAAQATEQALPEMAGPLPVAPGKR